MVALDEIQIIPGTPLEDVKDGYHADISYGKGWNILNLKGTKLEIKTVRGEITEIIYRDPNLSKNPIVYNSTVDTELKPLFNLARILMRNADSLTEKSYRPSIFGANIFSYTSIPDDIARVLVAYAFPHDSGIATMDDARKYQAEENKLIEVE